MAHNDHLQQPRIERKRGMAKGIFYSGIAMTSADFVIMAPDIETLRTAWETYSGLPLNEDKCAQVGLFAAKDIKELPMEPTNTNAA